MIGYKPDKYNHFVPFGNPFFEKSVVCGFPARYSRNNGIGRDRSVAWNMLFLRKAGVGGTVAWLGAVGHALFWLVFM